MVSSLAFKYDEEKSAKEKKERKDKQLKRIEEARKKAAEPKGTLYIYKGTILCVSVHLHV